jgi:hypothetical protein
MAVVRGTRLTVDFLLGLFAAGWTEAQVRQNYPRLTQELLRAVFAFAAETLGEPIGMSWRAATEDPLLLTFDKDGALALTQSCASRLPMILTR